MLHGERAGHDTRLPTDTHTRYDNGQYLFLVAFSPGRTFAKDKGAHQNEQHEGCGIVSIALLEFKA